MSDPIQPDWWLMVRVDHQLHLYQLGPVEGDAMGEAIDERTAALGVPSDWWDRQAEGWGVALSLGEPHQSLVDSAVVVVRLGDT
ncbi:hypothetical protein [Micromonospora zamorensis]|uniref:hypothetical protein n=1 Tax=Micromonospora zamorensis TaxID=709883 RepID=UPI003798E071